MYAMLCYVMLCDMYAEEVLEIWYTQAICYLSEAKLIDLYCQCNFKAEP